MNPLTLEKTADLLLQLLGVQSWCFYSVNCKSIKFSYTVDLTLFEAQRSKLTKSAHVKRLLSEFCFSFILSGGSQNPNSHAGRFFFLWGVYIILLQ